MLTGLIRFRHPLSRVHPAVLYPRLSQPCQTGQMRRVILSWIESLDP
jgi:hypothetical protein